VNVYEFSVFDLGAVEDAALSANPILRGGLLALKLANEGPGASAGASGEPAELPARGDSELRSFLVYVHHALGFDAVPLLRELSA
jgi:hypothetical protein